MSDVATTTWQAPPILEGCKNWMGEARVSVNGGEPRDTAHLTLGHDSRVQARNILRSQVSTIGVEKGVNPFLVNALHSIGDSPGTQGYGTRLYLVVESSNADGTCRSDAAHHVPQLIHLFRRSQVVTDNNIAVFQVMDDPLVRQPFLEEAALGPLGPGCRRSGPTCGSETRTSCAPRWVPELLTSPRSCRTSKSGCPT